jgi:PhnB protein
MAHSKKTKKPAAKAKKAAPIPRGYHTLTPHLVCRGAANAIDFYKKAFGAKERSRMLGPGGSIMHAELLIGESIMMLGDEMPDMGARSPHTIGGTATSLFIYTANVDKAYAKAIAAGAKPEMPPMDMFWGDRYCTFADPFGHKWAMATHLEDLTPKQMEKRGAEFMAQQAAGAPKA